MIKILMAASLLCLQNSVVKAGTAPAFTANFDSKKNTVLISWKHTSSETGTYLVQRSSDNQCWVDIALQAISLNLQDRSFSYEDKKRLAGKNYYRLKFIAVDGKAEFSAVVMVIIPAENNWVMYPVPVTSQLTLEYRGTESIKGVINIFIQRSSSGIIITRLRSSSLNRVISIPVDNLGRGIYDIRIIVNGDIIWNQRFVK